MTATYIIVILALLTMLGAIIFALVSKHKLEQRMENPVAPKSTLAADKSSTGKPADV